MPNFNILDNYRFGFKKAEKYLYKSEKGVNQKTINTISWQKSEPLWVQKFRLKAYKTFINKKMPSWGGDLSQINFDNFYFYIKPTKKTVTSWDDLPFEIKDTYDRIGIPEAEKKYLAGVNAQYESEVVYKSIQKELHKKGVIFLDMESGIKKYPELVKKYFSTVVPPHDNIFAALNSAVWSGGSFIYVPRGVKLELPLQAYYRINAVNMAQFERTLIIADEGSFVHYIEGCTAPIYSTDSLHAAVVEIIVKRGARVRYTTIQNWSNNVYNLVTKRMLIEEDGLGEWIDCNLGSLLTMKYPSLILAGNKARGEILSISYAGKKQHQDVGGKAIHLASETTSSITSKSISKSGGRTSYRGIIDVKKGLDQIKSKVMCDALILDNISRSDTYPTMKILSPDVKIEHEAKVNKIEEEKLFYMQSRGLTKEQAEGMIVNGFIEPIVKELPLEYAVEMNRLIQLQMEDAVG